MLQAGVLRNFKLGDAVLIWGDHDGIAILANALLGLRDGTQSEFQIGAGGGPRSLRIVVDAGGNGSGSVVRFSDSQSENLEWTCSPATLAEIAALVAVLWGCETGHQYVDVAGPVAPQVIISAGEYAADLAED
jgi:hypothetical protein